MLGPECSFLKWEVTQKIGVWGLNLLICWWEGSREGEEIIGRSWFPGRLKTRTPEKLGHKSICVGDCPFGVLVRVWWLPFWLWSRNKAWFCCRCFAVNMKSCSKIRGLRNMKKAWSHSSGEWRQRQLAQQNGFWTCGAWIPQRPFLWEVRIWHWWLEFKIRYGYLGLLETLIPN